MQLAKPSEPESIARRLVEAIEREIPSDARKAVKLPSRAALAQRYKVSLSTVTVALKHLQRRKRVHWVPGKGIYSGSGVGTTRLCSAALVGWFSHLTGAESSVDSYRWYLLHDLISEGANAQFQITVIPNDEKGPLNFDHLKSTAVDALLLKDVADPAGDIARLRKLGVPILSDGTKYSAHGVPSVSYDNLAMVRQMVTEFASRGHQRIAYLGMETSHPEQNEAMRQTFFASLVDVGLIYDYKSYWHNTPWAEWRSHPTAFFTEDTGYRIGKQMLSRQDRPSAIFAWQPHIAAGVAKAASELGLTVPKDLSIITDAIESAATSFSTFTQPHRELAARLLERLRGITDEPTLYFEDKLQKHFVDQGSIMGRV